MEKEIRNIVFDMGRVLLHFSTEDVISPYFPDPAEHALVYETIYGSGDWVLLDDATLTEDEAMARWKAKLPIEWHARLEELFARWPETMTPIEGMEELVCELKDAGYGCYVLSNASVRFEKYYREKSVFSHMDGLFVSAFYKMLKPDPAIYRRMCEEFSLDPEECFFIDDIAANIEGAAKVGMRGAQFPSYDVASLRSDLVAAGIRI
ncbi:MAG: HAD family phosphatase [Clostridia bacterium]|nr:HAD family phosphatase [Clostridia bacterium]